MRLSSRRRWSLNWDQINSHIVVGSCPRSASDIDRMIDEAGISAIICLQVRQAASTHHMIASTYCSGNVQSEACFEAMQIDWPVIRQQAMHRGVIMTRVAVRDFDHNDQVGVHRQQLPSASPHLLGQDGAMYRAICSRHDLLCICIGAECSRSMTAFTHYWIWLVCIVHP